MQRKTKEAINNINLKYKAMKVTLKESGTTITRMTREESGVRCPIALMKEKATLKSLSVKEIIKSSPRKVVDLYGYTYFVSSLSLAEAKNGGRQLIKTFDKDGCFLTTKEKGSDGKYFSRKLLLHVDNIKEILN